jgi:hypothetical protein
MPQQNLAMAMRCEGVCGPKEGDCKITFLFCDSPLLSQHNTFGRHCGVWVLDYESLQGYNVSVILVPCER